MKKGFTIFPHIVEASLYFYLGIEFLEKQMLGRASGEKWDVITLCPFRRRNDIIAKNNSPLNNILVISGINILLCVIIFSKGS